jgi:hypothetical protein
MFIRKTPKQPNIISWINMVHILLTPSLALWWISSTLITDVANFQNKVIVISCSTVMLVLSLLMIFHRGKQILMVNPCLAILFATIISACMIEINEQFIQEN